MPKAQLTGRLAALVGLGAAVSTATLVAFAAPAFAADASKSTSCTDKVNIRSKPSATAPVIGSCSAGEKITTDQSRDGFSHLTAKNGWVSNQYIKDASSDSADDSSSSGSDPSNSADPSDDNGPDGNNNDNGGHHHHSSDSGGGGLLGGGL
jgi:uncharacterized protein YgiM (DUF1202 family)